MERKRADLAQALRMTHDELTGLPNRTLFLDRLQLALGRLERRSRSAAVMFVDLDGFRTVNETLGREAGDRVVLAAADRLRKLMRPGDTVARFGADEFMLLCDDIASPEDEMGVAKRLRAGLSDAFAIGGEPVWLGACIGVVLATDRARPAEALVRDAERGMRDAKRRGVGVELYSPRPLQAAGPLPAA
jgi:diguanylate cyclase (GGDEF)-like protein